MKKLFWLSLLLVLNLANAQDENSLKAVKNELSSIHGVRIENLRKIFPDKSELKKVISDIGVSAATEKYLRVNAITSYGKLVEIDYHNGLSLNDQEFYLDLSSQQMLMKDENLRSALYRSLANTGSFEGLQMLNDFLNKEKEIYLKKEILEAAADSVKIDRQTAQLPGDMGYGSLAEINPLLKEPYYKRQDAQWDELLQKFSGQAKTWYNKLSSTYQKDPVIMESFEEMKKNFTLSKRLPGSVVEVDSSGNQASSSHRHGPDHPAKSNLNKDNSRSPQSVEDEVAVEEKSDNNFVRYALILALLGITIFFFRKLKK